MKKLADLLTGMRFILAGWIAFTAWSYLPEEAMGRLVALLLIAWTSDVLDGALARRSGSSQQTWLGSLDLEADLSVSLALAFSLAVWGGASTYLLVAVLLAGTIGWVLFRSVAPINLGMGMIYGLFILMAWRQETVFALVILGWLGAAILFNPTRAHQQVSGFLSESRRIILGETYNAPQEKEG
ncbi:MAG: CDP-alcohol phosphatidyltransferase family protein [Anaerolineales bacterium]|nr:CDP-alcohol phosphatidyltransferase family protein [Anaerolineales bacterium]